MDFFTTFFASIDERLTEFFSDNIAGMMDYVSPVVHTCAVLLIIGVGIGLISGKFQAAPASLVRACGLIVLVTELATNVGSYNTYVSEFFLGLPDELLSVISGYSTVSGIGETLDSCGDQLTAAIAAFWSSSSGITGSVAAGFICLAVWVFGALFAICVVVVALIAKVSLVILITVGPLFIMLLLLPQTVDYFSKWLTYVIQFALLAVLIGGILAICSDIILEQLTALAEAAGDIDWGSIFPSSIVLGVSSYLFYKLPDMTGALSGSIGTGIGALGHMVAGTASAPFSATWRRFGGEALQSRKEARMLNKRNKHIARKSKKDKKE